jgi:epsilon-lactone hydrolase
MADPFTFVSIDCKGFSSIVYSGHTPISSSSVAKIFDQYQVVLWRDPSSLSHLWSLITQEKSKITSVRGRIKEPNLEVYCAAAPNNIPQDWVYPGLAKNISFWRATMPSFKSKLFYFTLRNRHLLRLRLKPETWDMDTSVSAFRELAEKSNERFANQLPEGMSVEAFAIGPMKAEWLLPTGVSKEKVILYAIGGGYISGSLNDHRQIVAKVAKATSVAVLIYEHRNAPEHPYPAALEDSLTTYRWLLEQGTAPANILIMGESAGGGLCLATLLAIRDQNLPLPAGGVALSPWTDLKLTGESYHTKKNVCISPPGMNVVCSKHYIGDHDPEDPYISPLYGDLHGLPPLFINVGEWETMLDDSTRFAEKARQSGVDVTLRVGEQMVHCYPLMAPLFPEATQAMEEIAAYIKGRLKLPA